MARRPVPPSTDSVGVHPIISVEGEPLEAPRASRAAGQAITPLETIAVGASAGASLVPRSSHEPLDVDAVVRAAAERFRLLEAIDAVRGPLEAILDAKLGSVLPPDTAARLRLAPERLEAIETACNETFDAHATLDASSTTPSMEGGDRTEAVALARETSATAFPSLFPPRDVDGPQRVPGPRAVMNNVEVLRGERYDVAFHTHIGYGDKYEHNEDTAFMALHPKGNGVAHETACAGASDEAGGKAHVGARGDCSGAAIDAFARAAASVAQGSDPIEAAHDAAEETVGELKRRRLAGITTMAFVTVRDGVATIATTGDSPVWILDTATGALVKLEDGTPAAFGNDNLFDEVYRETGDPNLGIQLSHGVTAALTRKGGELKVRRVRVKAGQVIIGGSDALADMNLEAQRAAWNAWRLQEHLKAALGHFPAATELQAAMATPTGRQALEKALDLQPFNLAVAADLLRHGPVEPPKEFHGDVTAREIGAIVRAVVAAGGDAGAIVDALATRAFQKMQTGDGKTDNLTTFAIVVH
jgi:hypothetical protein